MTADLGSGTLHRVPPARRSNAAPYTIEQAVDDEKEFWRHIGVLLDQGIEKALAKRGFDEVLSGLKTTARTQKLIADQVGQMSAKQAALTGAVDHLTSTITVRSADTDLLAIEVGKLVKLLRDQKSEPLPTNGEHEKPPA